MKSFQMMYKSQFQKMDPYDWFCGPGSHLFNWEDLDAFENEIGYLKSLYFSQQQLN